MAEVSVMVYYTPAFKAFVTDPIKRIKMQIAYANQVFAECVIPVKLHIFCIEELEGFVEHPDPGDRLEDFRYAKKNLLNTADIGILMTGTQASDGNLVCSGRAKVGPSKNPLTHPPIAWVYPEDILSFVHEVGHIFGCRHDKDSCGVDGIDVATSNYGYHMKGSQMHTIMAYGNDNYTNRIPRFSSKDHTYEGVSLGNAENDNRSQIMRNRFLVSQFGDESGDCGHFGKSYKNIFFQSLK